VVFVGLAGSGKGTQAKLVAKETGLAHISTGDLLRGATGELKEQVDEVINSGRLIPNDLMLHILNERIQKPDCRAGIILDGFPRNLEQAKLLDHQMQISKVVEISVSDDEVMKRMLGRVTCKECGAGYNLHTAPKPADSKKCDECGGELVRRKDDNPEAIRKRIATYHEDTEPILKHYGDKVVKVNGKRDINDIKKDILKVLKSD